MRRFLFLLLLATLWSEAGAQVPDIIRRLPRGGGGGGAPRSGSDTSGSGFERRNRFEDSLTITYRLLDSTRTYYLDTTINEFRQNPVPPTFLYLGNIGAPARSLLFTPKATTGWDPGFHAYDAYRWRLADTRFFNTTRPYTELGFVLGAGQQQMLEVLHTQNVKPHWNAAFQYRLINAPGFFSNQQAKHNNYQITSWYQSPNRRYNNYFVVLKNNLRAQENGGLISTALLDSPRYQENRFLLPTRLGYDQTPEPREFGRNLSLGNEYKETVGFMRQQYDFGQKDSLVTDTIVIPLFYPRLRLEHDFRYSSQDYRFVDFTGQDSAYFKSIYNQEAAGDSFQFRDVWRELTNDFSIYQFPDAKNLQQYIKLGATLQLLKGRLRGGDQGFYNFIGHGEYRNRTRNGKWDIQAFGRLHFTGLNAGDYHAYVSLLRISEQLGSLQLGFQNTNRSPSMIYDERSHFYLDAPNSFGKENTIHFFAQTELRRQRLQLRGDYFITTNYLYLTKNYLLQQESSLFNVLRVSARKSFRIGRHWNWHTEAYLQQKAGNAEVHFPLLLTRNRFAFEGNFFKNLHLSTGLEVRYHSPFKADDYSPVLGQFFYQDSVTISNRPDIHAYLHFRIRTFRGYVRVENLNTLSFANGIGFHKNNLAAPNYPYPPRMIRFGVYWVFVN